MRGQPAVPLRDGLHDPLGHRLAAADVLELGAFRVGGERQDEQPPAGGSGAPRGRLERACAEVGGDGEGVAGQRPRQVGVGVAVHGRADVASFDVRDRGHPGLPAGREGLLQRGHARRPVPLVEGRLRFEGGDPVGEGVHGAQREFAQPGGVVGQAPGLQQSGVGIDAGAHRAALGHQAREPDSEGLGCRGPHHDLLASRAASYS